MSLAGMVPHQVEILYDLENAPNAPVCAGTIISSYFILTIASCLAGQNESLFKIRANGENGNESQIRRIDDVYSYAALDSDPSPFDVAVIQLNSELELDNLHTSKIRYGQNQFLTADDFSDETSTCFESGFREVNTVDSSLCSEILEGKDEKNFICIESVQNPGLNFAGNGRSQLPLVGSSLICSDVLYGILAINSTTGGETRGKRVYTNVLMYSHWIRFVYEAPHFGLTANAFGAEPVNQIKNPVPYQLSLRYDGRHVCGGVILNKKTALSAAHCFDPHYLNVKVVNKSSFSVIAGEQNLTQDDKTEQTFQIEAYFQHPKYKNILKGNDIAVIQVKGKFKFTDRVKNVWISSPTTQTPNFQDFRGTATGWGITGTHSALSPVLLSVDLEFLEHKRCKTKWPFLKDSMICGYSNVTNNCAGDSGGPLVIKNYEHSNNMKKDLLVGISSFGPQECEKQNEANGFTNVSYFYEWIAQKTSNSLWSSSQFQCFNGECIDNELKCDQKFDCEDGSDEKVCSSQTLKLDYKMNAGEMPPHQVEIYDLEGATNATLVPVCEGTIISSYFILTVASCFVGRNERFIKIRANGKHGNESQFRTIDDVFSYAARDSDPSPFDVALIQLNSELELDNLHTSKIPYNHNQFTSDYVFFDEDSGCRARGFREVNTILPSNCSEMLERKEEKNFICTEVLENPRAGNGSYQLPLVGSSLICGHNLYGLLAMNSSTDVETLEKRVYTSVAKYFHWIRLVLEEEDTDYDDDYGLGAISFGGILVNRIENPVPYQLSILFNGSHVCGGVILDKKTVLSAAHCFDPHYLKAESFDIRMFSVVAGAQNLHQYDSTEQIFLIEKLVKHPNFTSITKGNDLAVIWIEGEFNFTDRGRVNNVWISFPSNQTPNFQDLNGTEPGYESSMDNMDYGDFFSTILKPVDLNFLEQARCKRQWPFLTESMFCGNSNVSNLCSGPSGGPLVLKNYSHGDSTTIDLLVGISSFGSKKCEEQEMPRGFTNVSYFYDWIAETRSNSLCLPCEFQCFNGECIHKEWKCDQKFDCEDGSDEKMCSSQTQADEAEKVGCKKEREELARQTKDGPGESMTRREKLAALARERRKSLAMQAKKDKLDTIKQTKTFPKYQEFDLNNRTSIQKAGRAEVGSWGPVEYCPKDSIVTGFMVKFVPYRGPGDDYGLVGIGLVCTNVFNNALTKEIRSDYFTDKDIADLNNLAVNSTWLGSFFDPRYNCPQRHPAIGFEIKNQPNQSSQDNFGAVNFNLICSGSRNGRLRRPPIEFDTVTTAKWSEDVMCPPLTAVCGLRTKVHRVDKKTDSSGLTDVELQCCHMVEF